MARTGARRRTNIFLHQYLLTMTIMHRNSVGAQRSVMAPIGRWERVNVRHVKARCGANDLEWVRWHVPPPMGDNSVVSF